MGKLKAISAGAKALFGKSKERVSKVSPLRGLDFLQETLVTGERARNLPQWYKNNPLMAGGFTAGGAAFAGDVVGRPIRDAVFYGESLEEALRRDRQTRMSAEVSAISNEQLRQRMMESAARLAAVDPQLYNEVMAGRKLPQGAAVFGGQPRTDLMDQLALDMAQGKYQTQPTPDEQLLQILGAQ